jgi:hypothetical protein
VELSCVRTGTGPKINECDKACVTSRGERIGLAMVQGLRRSDGYRHGLDLYYSGPKYLSQFRQNID